MLIFLALVADAAATGPRLLNGAEVVTYRDYPSDAVRDSRIGVTTVRLTVSPEGRVTGCETAESTGMLLLDRRSCHLFTKRARFEPAKDASGRPVQATYYSAVSWQTGELVNAPADDLRYHTTIDWRVDTARRPPGYASPAYLKIDFDGTGAATACTVNGSSGSAAFDQAACRELRKTLRLQPPRARVGAARAIRYARVSLG